MLRKTHHKTARAWEISPFRMYVVTLVDTMSWKVALALTLMVCVGVTESIGLLLLVPFLGLVGLDVQQGTLGWISQSISSMFAAADVHPTLIAVLALYVATISAQALLRRWQKITNDNLNQDFVVSLRRRLYRAIAGTNWLYFSRSRSSDFTHALTTELLRVGTGTSNLLLLFSNAVVVFVYLLLALRLSATISVLALVCGAGLLLLLKGKMQVARRTGKQLTLVNKGLTATVTEHLGGMKVTKSYGAEARSTDEFSTQAELAARAHEDFVRNKTEVTFWFDVGLVLVLGFILYVSVQILAAPTAAILLLLFLFARIMPKFSQIQQSYQSVINTLPAFVEVMEMVDRCEAAAEPRPETAVEVKLHHGIRLEEVSFAYREEVQTAAIRDLNLAIEAGKTTAIVGPSGAGKSTVADLVMGLIVPTRGRVLVDEMPLDSERVHSWRTKIGYVAQDTFLFNDTVRSNLLWARPEASEEEIREALRLAAAEGFVSELPEGLETVLGDRGVRLSGGERQRLALARALLRRPSMLILDEATSALDSENEGRIQGAIEGLHGHTTILVITHRLSTVRGADVIHVLERGRLVESGSWEALIGEENGRLNELAKAQGI